MFLTEGGESEFGGHLAPQALTSRTEFKGIMRNIVVVIIIIIIRNLYIAIMPLGGYRGAGGTGS